MMVAVNYLGYSSADPMPTEYVCQVRRIVAGVLHETAFVVHLWNHLCPIVYACVWQVS
jgi:hypothetical protein